MGEKIGLDCKLYKSPALSGAPGTGTWTELTKAREVTMSLEASEADVTSRASGGWRHTRQTLKDGSLEFEMIWDPDDSVGEDIRSAYFDRTKIALAAMDGDIAVAGSKGFVSNYYITGWSRPEPLEEGVTISVTAKPADYQAWYEVPA